MSRRVFSFAAVLATLAAFGLGCLLGYRRGEAQAPDLRGLMVADVNQDGITLYDGDSGKWHWISRRDFDRRWPGKGDWFSPWTVIGEGEADATAR